jgi:DNA helicase HerA-like ATPase
MDLETNNSGDKLKMVNKDTLVGRIIDVEGGAFLAELLEDDQEKQPVVTIGDEDIAVGRLGSYALVVQGDLHILAMVSRMSEQEKLSPGEIDSVAGESIKIPSAERTLKLVPLGSLSKEGVFERGVPVYPTTGAEVHAVSSKELEAVFVKFKSRKYDVGHYSSNESLRVYLEPTATFGRHLAIVGQTGSGKSWTVAKLLQRAVEIMPKAHIVLLDLHGEYCWKDDAGNVKMAFPDSMARHVDATQLEVPYWLLTFTELCDLFIDRSEFTAHNQIAFFRDTVFSLKQSEKTPLKLERVTVDTPVFFSLEDLLNIAKETNAEMVPGKTGPKQGPLFGQFDRFIIRLESRMNDPRYDFLLKPKVRITSETLSPLLRDFIGLGDPKQPITKRPITIIDISAIPFDVRPTVTAQIGRLAFEFNYWNPQYRDFPILLVCEEAHSYIPREESSQFTGARKSMERIAKEGRKYGVGLAVVSQRPHEVSETVLAQCGSFICLRMTNPDDQNYVRSILPEAERGLIDTLAALGRGEAMILGEGVPLPTRIQFDKPDPTPNSDDIKFYEKWQSGPDDLNVDAIVDNWRKQRR